MKRPNQISETYTKRFLEQQLAIFPANPHFSIFSLSFHLRVSLFGSQDIYT